MYTTRCHAHIPSILTVAFFCRCCAGPHREPELEDKVSMLLGMGFDEVHIFVIFTVFLPDVIVCCCNMLCLSVHQSRGQPRDWHISLDSHFVQISSFQFDTLLFSASRLLRNRRNFTHARMLYYSSATQEYTHHPQESLSSSHCSMCGF